MSTHGDEASHTFEATGLKVNMVRFPVSSICLFYLIARMKLRLPFVLEENADYWDYSIGGFLQAKYYTSLHGTHLIGQHAVRHFRLQTRTP